jgi:methylmalonyl-CoA mutase cobalamin-binding domain/chain
MAKLDEAGVTIPVVVGGTIPEQDIPTLQQLGVRKVFLPSTPLDVIVREVTAVIEQFQREEAVV